MKTEEQFRIDLNPFLEMVKSAKQTNNGEFLRNVTDFKNLLIEKNICGIKDNPFLLDKFIDEIIEQE